MSVTVEEAVDLALSHITALPEECVPLAQAVGRVLSRTVYAPMEQPPFHRSAMDGYAVRAADIEGASPEFPVCLKVVDKCCAGQEARVAVGPGEAVRIMTGAMVPQGADSVIRQEDTDLGEEHVTMFRNVKLGSNVCRRGEEYASGEVLLSAGTMVDAAAVAVAAGAGLTELTVRRRVRVSVLSTGDELCPPGQALPAGKIYDSNTAYLTARLSQLGVEVVRSLRAADGLTDITQAIKSCGDCDILITTGGVSVGQKDLVAAAADAAGASVLFHGINMKPGMPTLLARCGDLLLLGLSGNPFAAAVPFELLLRPMLAKMTGDPSLVPVKTEGIAANGFPKGSPTRRYLRGKFADGVVSIPAAQANGQMRSMVGCNCLVEVPAGSGPVQQGDRVQLHLL